MSHLMLQSILAKIYSPFIMIGIPKKDSDFTKTLLYIFHYSSKYYRDDGDAVDEDGMLPSGQGSKRQGGPHPTRKRVRYVYLDTFL